MENFKLENFKLDHPEERTFDVNVSKDITVREVQARLCKKFSQETIGIDLVKVIREKSLYIGDVSESVSKIFNQEGIKQPETIFLNWYRFDAFDEMLFSDFIKCFDYIWYPSADDLDIFDQSLSWILSIDHDGSIFLWKEPKLT